MENPNQKQINIEIAPEMAGGIYSNLAVITHSQSEFVVDFVQMMPGIPKPKVASRIVMTPEHAKRLLMALHDNIAKFESENGEIKIRKQGMTIAPLGLGDA
ncbi:MAG: DUF3467 domain-containing protein [Bacteroidales bacterium]|nr:DUF3467 domain-containing protein [Bacteroidales bacterium]